MTRPWRLTRRAEAALADIADWTRSRFGNRQTERYADELIACCERIANGTAVTRSCRDAFAVDVPERLRMARAGQHFLIFIETPARIIITDVLHVARDLPARLRDL